MKQQKRVEWTRLDNASKIFPATCSYKDTKVFRLTCELYEAIKPDVLQQALNMTIEDFPLYKSVLRRGVFWYYFEKSDIKPMVELESKPVCAPIYLRDERNLLFRVFYYNNRINLEIFHALSDGTGALWFMQTLVYNYLMKKESFSGKEPKLNYEASVSRKMDDSFGKYFTGRNIIKLQLKSIKKKKSTKAFRVRGIRLDENRMNLIEGSMSAKEVLEQAHLYNTTLTIYITSLFIYSIQTEMSAHRKDQSVVLSVPINLRQYFSSDTARNFFSTMNIGYNFLKNGTSFENVIQSVTESFQKELTEERVNEHIIQLVSWEKSLLTRAIPLPLKDYSLRLVNKIKDKGITAAISNLGRITMPQEFEPYIRQFGVSTSARRPQICMCTYGDRLVVSFTTPFLETEIQRTFFEFLSKKGIEIEISTNLQ